MPSTNNNFRLGSTGVVLEVRCSIYLVGVCIYDELFDYIISMLQDDRRVHRQPCIKDRDGAEQTSGRLSWPASGCDQVSSSLLAHGGRQPRKPALQNSAAAALPVPTSVEIWLDV